MRWIAQGLTIALLAFGVTFGALEIGIRWAGLFDHERRLAAEGQVDAVPAQNLEIPGAILHPSLGYTQRPGTTYGPPAADTIARFFDGEAEALRRYAEIPPELRTTSINLQGFASHVRDYTQVDGAKYVIGIFGGSVADAFAGVLRLGLKADLARALGVPGDSLEILNFAKGGYRQPQQLTALIQALLMHVPLDLAVNIDGFNEVAMAGLDCDAGYDPRSPSALQYLPVVSSLTHGGSRATLEAILRVDALRQREARVRAAVRAWPLDRLEAAKVVTGALIARWTRERLRLEGSLQTDLARAPAADGAVLLPAVHASASGCPELTADVWERSSSMMNVVARQAGVSYLHAIQPNQYVADSKRLSSDELALAWSPQLPAAQAARVGYPHLLRRVPQMRAAGIDVVDLTGLFGDVAETVYVDQCCHLNYRGNRLLFEGVLTAMARSAEETPGEAGARLRPDTSQ